MTLLDKLGDKECWEKFYEYKLSLCGDKSFPAELRRFIDSEGYRPVYRNIKNGTPFPLPKRSEVSKLGKQKKRVVYTYPDAENTVLKLLTYLMLRKYDGLFSRGLYSFRPGRNAKDAVRLLTRHSGIDGLYAYKADISNYFNSVPVDKLLPMIESALDDKELAGFLAALVSEPCAIKDGRPLAEQKGIMAGTPLSAFYANLYLAGLDKLFEQEGALYVRYSDDIIVFAHSAGQIRDCAVRIKEYLSDMGLCINPDKEQFFSPGEGWVFLGFCYKDGVTDIAPATLKKLKKKMKRKADSLARWAQRRGLPSEKAAAAFIRIFNSKLFEQSGDNELCWAMWFFPLLNTDSSLRVIDAYMQDCLRYIISGRRTKKRFDVRYKKLKQLGYRSLVNEYYRFKKDMASGS
ncbi:reverse transcriptase/maturase family protein [Ruminococcus sp. NK3A76]|uniref:reverse transcriptase/maturase family protein n=1 Tax=Ruminococcus sp. NK3A76 TaxID=877411 RepID=UPI00048FF52B|nr:reverse transcriptase/maturase family protein [Ruminococcus sp. NK3A76]